MKKYFILLVLLFPALFFMSWIGILMHQMNQAHLVEVPITGYDPRDILRGHYLRYQIDYRSFYSSDYPDCQLPKGSSNRYFIPDNEAKQLDLLFRSNQHRFSIIFSCQKGHKAIATQLLINGQDWHEIIKGK